MKTNTNSCIALDDNKLEEVEISTREYNEILDFQQKILNMIASHDNFFLILESLCKLAEQLLPNSVASIMMINPHTGRMSVLSAPSVPQVGHDALSNLKPGIHGGSCGNAVFHNEPQFVSNTFKDSRWKDLNQLAIDFNLCSCWSMPIRNDKYNAIGSFALSSFEHRSPSSFHKKLLEVGASIVNVVLKNKDIEQKLTLFSSAMEHASDGILITSEENNIIEVNQSFLDTYGYQKKDILGLNPKIFSSNKNNHEIYVDMWKSIKETTKWAGELVNKDAHGNEVIQWVSISTMPEQDMYLAIFTDLTEIRNVQSELAKEKNELKKLSLAVEQSHSMIMIIDTNDTVEYINHSFLNFFDEYNSIGDIQKKDLKISSKFEEYDNKSYVTSANINGIQWLDYIKSHPNEVFKVAIKKEDNLHHFIIRAAQTSSDMDSNIVIELSDITEDVLSREKLKEKEKILFEQSKMASMGEMIGNIAHQWRQPLSVISTGATGMQLQKEYGHLTDAIFVDTCNLINKNAQYLSRTIDDFKNFIKGDRLEKQFNLTKNIHSFLHLVEGSIKNHDIHIVLDLEKNVEIMGYENELTQCLINIFNNAKDILDESNLKTKIFYISTKLSKGHVEIILQDNAGGILENILPKIFEPYFTTKHSSQGTGLGLSMVYNIIVDGMNGIIKASNEEFTIEEKKYSGATFRITLPR